MYIYLTITLNNLGKFIPTITKKIHDENLNNPEVYINMAGMGIGDGFMSPPDSSIYGNFLYQVCITYCYIQYIVYLP